MSQTHTRPVDTNVNNLELHKGDNFIFGIDVSASMAHADCPGGAQRIEYLKEKVKSFVHEAAKYDDDGIDIISFGHSIRPMQGVTPEKADDIINGLHATEMSTNTAGLITAAYNIHKVGNYPRTTLFIATDGEPSDREAVKKAIVDITNDVKTDREFCISILTVGVISNELQHFLTDLDENLKGAKYDIVDVKTLEEVDFFTAFDGAQND